MTPTPVKRLLLFGFGRLDGMLAKGNLAYVTHYEQYFDEVHVAYLRGASPPVHVLGRTRFESIGSAGDNRVVDVMLAPIRLLRAARRLAPTSYLTADLVFGWWSSLLIRTLLGARLVLMPVCLPESIYESTGRSLHGLPIWLERQLMRLTFRAADRIISGRHSDAIGQWLRRDPVAAPRTIITSALVEEYPTPEFYASATAAPIGDGGQSGVPMLLYVGRLHAEKRAADLIEMMGILRDRGIDARLELAGDGPARAAMADRAAALGVADRVVFHGYVPNATLAGLYRRATVFVSTVTGTALREAGLVGTPIVAYAIAWVAELLRDGDTALLAREADPADLADKVARALGDAPLRRRVGAAFHREALARWPLANIALGLRQAFDPDSAAA